MAQLIVFNMQSLDGFIADARGDMSWAHMRDREWQQFVEGNARGGGVLLFGRVTYEMMASYWPTPMAAKNDPVVAAQMNALPKVVFSRTLRSADWNNTRLIKDGLAAEVRKMKKGSDQGLVLMGSASVVSLLSQERLVDEYQVVLFPVVLGSGKSMFAGVTDKLPLKLKSTRAFKNGAVLLCYEPAR